MNDFWVISDLNGSMLDELKHRKVKYQPAWSYEIC